MTPSPLELTAAASAAPGLVDDGDGTPGLDVREIARVAWARRRFVLAWAGAGAALLLLLAFVIPAQYVADVSLLEAPRPGANPTLDQLGISAQVLGIRADGGPTNALTFPDILRSRRLLEGLLARRFPLADGRTVLLEEYLVHGRPSPQRTDRAVRKLRERFDIGLDRRTNLLRVSVTDHDPALAAAVVNAAGLSLQDIVMHSMMTQAGANRRFVETRMAEARVDLAHAEDALERFRETNRHPDDSPRLLMEQGRLVRDLRTREEVLVALGREYEMARVDENRDVPVLNVLDTAQPPAFRSSPRRLAMAAGGLLLGLVAGIALAWRGRAVAKAAGDLAEAA